MADAFWSSSEDVVKRGVDVINKTCTPLEKLDELYEIKTTCDFIGQHQFEKVALQFPDDLLLDSAAVAAEIERNSEAKVFILGDTSYGSCCVDEVAAEHAGADCIVHYGSTCLSPSKRLPLMYIFEKGVVDLDKCAACFREFYPDTQTHIIILYDVNYSHVIDDVTALLSSEYPNLVVSELVVEGDRCYSQGQIKRKQYDCLSEQDNIHVIYEFGRQVSLKSGLSITDYSMFYIGQEGATLRNFMMTWNRCSFCSFDPTSMTGARETAAVSRALMKRYYAIERAKDANVVGILVGTLGVANYLSIIQQLKETIHRAGKKSYMFAMGKLSVAKLANFMEIDVFVLIACPENSLLDSSKFFRPVVTPFEMDVACNRNREWSEEYVTDFQHLLPGGQSHVPLPDWQEKCDETDVSLISGALRSQHLMDNQSAKSQSSSLVLRNQTMTIAQANSAASFLGTRSWRGLEQKLGETPVVKAVEGRRGLAIAYEEEGTQSQY
ncbi:2-(3-amino-3-carboxypropyl)histidine synthase subunit 2 [Aulostomus maculatus]